MLRTRTLSGQSGLTGCHGIASLASLEKDDGIFHGDFVVILMGNSPTKMGIFIGKLPLGNLIIFNIELLKVAHL